MFDLYKMLIKSKARDINDILFLLVLDLIPMLNKKRNISVKKRSGINKWSFRSNCDNFVPNKSKRVCATIISSKSFAIVGKIQIALL